MTRRREKAFSLLEVLAALMVAALALGLFYPSATTSLARQRALASEAAAFALARSNLARVGSEIPLAEGESTGSANEFAWRIAIREEPDPESRFHLFRVASEVSWPGPNRQDRVELSVLRLGTGEGRP